MKFYKALLNNGEWVKENDFAWEDIKDRVVGLEFHNNDQIISFPRNVTNFIQCKSASGNLSTGECKIESRNFSFLMGSICISVRIDEKTNNIKIETKDVLNANSHSPQTTIP